MFCIRLKKRTEAGPVVAMRMALAAAWAIALAACAPQRFDAMDAVPLASSASPGSAGDSTPSDPGGASGGGNGSNPGTGPGGGSPIVSKTVETFLQDDSAGKADILIVDDNSRSMDAEQSKMARKFSSFVSALSDIDYHIGVTTTDLDSKDFNMDGRLLPIANVGKFISPSTIGASDAFLRTIQRPETATCKTSLDSCPSGNEQALGAAIRAMRQKDAANSGFFRDRVDLTVVFLTDEDELSKRPSAATKPSQVLNAFDSAFGGSKRFQAHAIVVVPGDQACLDAQNAQVADVANASDYGTAAAELAAMTGGTVSSICDEDYAANLSAISENVRKLVSSFDLERAPIPGSVSVRITPSSADPRFVVAGKRVTFESPPPAGSLVEISYRY